MIVTRENIEQVKEAIFKCNKFSFDTETTGLYSYLGDTVFSYIVGTATETYYFNLIEYHDLDEKYLLDKINILPILEHIFCTDSTVFLHNAKFDLHMACKDLSKPITSKIHDTMVMARLLYNDHMKYSLEECCKRIGLTKDSSVDEYISKHKLYRLCEHPNGKKDKVPLYNLVPFEIITNYGQQDARITYSLGEDQLALFAQMSDSSSKSTPKAILDIETTLTPVLYNIEKKGIKIDRNYVEEAFEYEKKKIKEIEESFEKETGKEFIDSAKHMAPILVQYGDNIGKTEDGNPSISDYVLQDGESIVSKLILQHRDAYKRAWTYWYNFLKLSDEKGYLHPDFRQSGTRTGRMSCWDPNIQNIPKKDDSLYPIRRAIIPSTGKHLVEIDYKAQEFRLTLDYAGEQELSTLIHEKGHDPHQATADLTGLDRQAAKTLNFALIYGVGVRKLSKMLNCDQEKAAQLRYKYFSSLPGVKTFLRQAIDTAKIRGYVHTWTGRRLYFSDTNFAYRAPNAIIQGGCADIAKKAMNEIHSLGFTMLAQVHDSILLEMSEKEMQQLDTIKDIMRKAYPYKILPMDVSVEASSTNWGELKAI